MFSFLSVEIKDKAEYSMFIYIAFSVVSPFPDD